MKITWYGHSCFGIECQNERWILDPYKPDMVPGLAPLQLHGHHVLCSHEHEDHNYRAGVQLEPAPLHSVFELSYLDTYHDQVKGKKRGTNRIHILDVEGLRVVHLGDLGQSLSLSEIQQLGAIDVLLIPVGGTYTISSKQAYDLIERIQPRVILPMHYRFEEMGFPVLEPLDNFLENFSPSSVVHYESNLIEVTPSTPPHVGVLQYIP